jgi:ParB family transcriptional regulator, chromosome partitioning protein
MARQALGKGLGALINTRVANPDPVAEDGEKVLKLPLDRITPSPLQPRQAFHPHQLGELIASIRERGIVQPLIVREVDGAYELIAGERRWRAAKEVGLGDAPAIVRSASDREVLELALIENLQREDLNPIEEASAYARLHKDFSLTQEDIARRVGKSRAAVANSMRLLDLAEDVQSLVKQGRLSVGHAKVLLSVKEEAGQMLLADRVIKNSLSVRETEKLAATLPGRKVPRKPNANPTTVELAPALQRVQNLLTHHFATRVSLSDGGKKGTISIEYYGHEDLDRILNVLGIAEE